MRIVGEVRALRADAPDVGDLQSRQRPIYPGLSVGHPEVSAGTLGGFVRYADRLHLLNNSHVLADSGNPEADSVGTLATFFEFDLDGPNLADVALAVVADGIDSEPSAYPGGPVVGVTAEPPLDGLVEKVRRTTGLTAGRSPRSMWTGSWSATTSGF